MKTISIGTPLFLNAEFKIFRYQSLLSIIDNSRIFHEQIFSLLDFNRIVRTLVQIWFNISLGGSLSRNQRSSPRFISMEKSNNSNNNNNKNRVGPADDRNNPLVYYTNSGLNPIPGELKLFPRFLSCRLHYFRL